MKKIKTSTRLRRFSLCYSRLKETRQLMEFLTSQTLQVSEDVYYVTMAYSKHTLHFVGSKKRAFWLLLSLAALAMLSFHLFTIISSYLQYNSNVHIQVSCGKRHFWRHMYTHMSYFLSSSIPTVFSLCLNTKRTSLQSHSATWTRLKCRHSPTHLPQSLTCLVATHRVDADEDDRLVSCDVHHYVQSFYNCSDLVDMSCANSEQVFTNGLCYGVQTMTDQIDMAGND